MYAATKSEHLVPTTGTLFALTRSSTNLLATDTRFAASYLSYYAAKSEEHADSSIFSAPDGKHFRLRSEGIQNRNLASAQFMQKFVDTQRRHSAAINCNQLALTEAVFWINNEPFVLTNMSFIHIPNVPPEQRFVSSAT